MGYMGGRGYIGDSCKENGSDYLGFGVYGFRVPGLDSGFRLVGGLGISGAEKRFHCLVMGCPPTRLCPPKV